MGTLLQNLLTDAWKAPGAALEPFAPIARYYPAMDLLLYLNEDCSYRADRVDPFLTVLWHPYDQKLVGIKLKGFRFVFNQLRSVLDLKDEQLLPIVKALEVTLMGGMAEAIMQQQEPDRVQKLYSEAKKLTKDVSFDPREFYRDAALKK